MTVIGAAVLAGGVTLAAQSSQPVFRSGVELVTIDVVATSTDGKPVHGLKAEDFELSEDGLPQPIRTFQFIDASQPDDGSVMPPGVVSNATEPGGLFAIVIDEIGIYSTEVRDVRRVAERFLNEALLPHDHVAVVRAGVTSGFFLATDRTQALESVLASTGRRDRGLRLESPGATVEATGDLVSDMDVRSPGQTGRQSFGVLASVVERMRPIRARRKAILWFSRGGDLPANWENALALGLPIGRDEDALRHLIDVARAANVAIYTVDPRGLVPPDTSGSQAPRPADIEELGTHRDLAAATGGRAIVNTNDLDGALERVAVENRAYYLLGYEPAAAPDVKRPRVRRLQVTTRAPGVSLLHRSVYVPGRDEAVAEPELIAAPLPVRDLEIALAPAAVAIDRRKRGLLLPFEIGRDLPDGAEVEYTAVAFDASGKAVARTTGKTTADRGRAVGDAGLAVEARTYTVRFAARVAGSERKGMAFATVRIPAGRAKQPECGGIVFEQQGRRPLLRQFNRDAALTISTVISAEKLTGKLAFAVGAPARVPERTWPVEVGAPLANGLWRVVLNLNPPLPTGDFDVQILEDDLMINDNCLAQFSIR
jgi:VWFA-related protein